MVGEALVDLDQLYCPSKAEELNVSVESNKFIEKYQLDQTNLWKILRSSL